MKLSDLPRRVVSPLGEWPKPVVLTPAQIEARRLGRQAQIGKPKAANRISRRAA